MLDVNSEQAPFMAERAQVNMDKVTKFQLEVREELKGIQQRIQDVRTKISDNRGSEVNFNGFLVGGEDDYLDQFDD